MTALISRLVAMDCLSIRWFRPAATALPSLFAAVTVALAASLPVHAEAPLLDLPLACEPQKTCFIQHYMDAAPEGATQDFRCGHATYKGHNGIDFRILSAAAARQGVDVIAAAPGKVLGVRDGMADAFPREGDTGRTAISGRECGNGVVIDHGDGWQTQYCHMRQGSVRVTTGQTVERGTPLGSVGFSGLADSPHLHLTVRHHGKPVDPFTSRTPDGSCLLDPSSAKPLFGATVVENFPYRSGYFLQAGFAGRAVAWQELEHDHGAGQPAAASSEALIFFARLMHVRAGDRVRLAVSGPQGFTVATDGKALPRDQAIYLAIAGKKRTLPRWPPGTYTGRAALIRDDVEILTETREITIAD